ncbi:acyl-CoA dehydrogenase [Pseudomonas sp. TMW22090]|uniref:acyl-CoA dehydrogenase C-terminal domain-containing protein n=1 Tax=Pseudomonas sp. TMW22090 TaxID=2506434 RepID=UPI001F1016AC|nr:acyl-CoA dehydrogenase C-terminal domain-containing protein [Pseudomonas sp. TMW22090]MCH4875919.1 acyl-CoA dehydrogenase [Pseudomonas sp. TMW22090]
MSSYAAPVDDYNFLLNNVLDYAGLVLSLPGYEDFTPELIEAIISEGARLAENELAPLNRTGDEEGCVWDNGQVRTPRGFKAAFELYREGGWTGLVAAHEYGGQGLPHVIGLIIREITSAANSSFGTYAGLTQGAYQAIYSHGSKELKDTFLPRLVNGNWTGTMCLTEPHCGSDLGLLKTRAELDDSGSYKITGTKIFVTGGEHDLSQNIVHLVLARLPDGPPGVKGISLFAVPKFLPTADGIWSQHNNVVCTGIEHKMGMRASATASLAFEGAQGWLVGQPHRGMKAMFTMMNGARLGVSVQAVSLAEAASQKATEYATERLQGREPGHPPGSNPIAIINHPDVRRNLLIGKSFVEGARALWMWAGIHLDRRHHHPDLEVRAECEDLLALLTPVLKAFFSDQSFEATNAAVQVFGGHGYIRETGIEQFVRDGRIISLYEGTNGIQGLDLIHRKIQMNDGRTVNSFFELIDKEVNALSVVRTDLAELLGNALSYLRSATRYVTSNAQNDEHLNGAASHHYLQLFGLVAMGFAWAKIVRASLQLTDAADFGFAQAKVKTGNFFFKQTLPKSEYHYKVISTSSQVTMDMSNEEFLFV